MAREGKPPAFQFYAADWLADEDVAAMSLEEEGAYIRLLAYHWREGSIPADPDRLARLLRVRRTDFDRIWQAVGLMFAPGADPDRLVNARLVEQRADMDAFKETQRVAGAKGARARWQSHGDPMATPCARHGDPIDSPMAKNGSASASASASAKEQEHSSAQPPKRVRPSFDLAALYAAYPRQEGKAPGLKRLAARIKSQEDYDRCARAVANYAAKVARDGTEPRFVLLFSTFANGRWEDYVDGAPAAAPGANGTVPREEKRDYRRGMLPLPEGF